MGAWGARNFENDTALDWAGDFAERQELPLLQRAFAARSADPDAALAAAEVVAALNGHPPADLPPGLTDWSQTIHRAGQISDRRLATLISRATEAVRGVMASSLTRDLWAETSDFETWLAVQRDLLERLGRAPAPPSPIPAPPAPSPPQIWLTSLHELSQGSRPVPYDRDTFFRDPPSLSGAQVHGDKCLARRVEIEVTEAFLDEDFAALGEWLALHPGVTVLVRDALRGSKWEKGRKADPRVLLNFAKVRRLIANLQSARGAETGPSQLTELDSLGLYKMKIKDLRGIAALPRLTRLEIWKTPCDLSPLADCRTLTMVSIHDTDDLSSVDAIGSVIGLETLQLIELPLLTALPSMARLASLRHVYLRLGNLKDLTPLAEAPQVRELIVVGSGDRWPPEAFEFLRGHPTLEKLLFIPIEGPTREKQYVNLLGLPRPASAMPVQAF